jgi:phosphatidylglycerophosphatase A
MARYPATVFTNPVHFLAYGFGSGCAPRAPGTFGTLAAVPVYLLLAQLPVPFYLLTVLLAFVAGVWICGKTSRDVGVHDPGGIVWDEFVGFWLTMTLVPPDWYWVLAGFILFRVFDILKPFPIGLLDKRVGGGLGIMLDDVLAGIYACGCLQALILLLPLSA